MNQPKRVRRIDGGGSLRLPTIDSWGNMRVDAIVVKPGVYSYRQPDGTIRRELKPADEIFSPKHMASVRDAAVTDEHLPGGAAVTPSNARETMRGHATGVERLDTDEMMVPLKITDKDMIGQLERKEKRGVSLGLDIEFDPTPGVWQGQPYDGVQRAMLTNQISITDSPRVGGAEIRLDSGDAVMVDDPPREERKHMTTMKITIGDSTVEVDPGAGSVIQARLTKLDSELVTAREEATASTKLKDEALAKLDTATDELKKKKGLTIDAADIPKLFAVRSKVIEGAKLLLDSKAMEKAEELSDGDLRRESCEAQGVKVGTADDGKSDDFVEARFDGLVELKRDSNDGKLDLAVAGVTPIHPDNAGGEGKDSLNAVLSKVLSKIDSRHEVRKEA